MDKKIVLVAPVSVQHRPPVLVPILHSSVSESRPIVLRASNVQAPFVREQSRADAPRVTVATKQTATNVDGVIHRKHHAATVCLGDQVPNQFGKLAEVRAKAFEEEMRLAREILAWIRCNADLYDQQQALIDLYTCVRSLSTLDAQYRSVTTFLGLLGTSQKNLLDLSILHLRVLTIGKRTSEFLKCHKYNVSVVRIGSGKNVLELILDAEKLLEEIGSEKTAKVSYPKGQWFSSDCTMKIRDDRHAYDLELVHKDNSTTLYRRMAAGTELKMVREGDGWAYRPLASDPHRLKNECYVGRIATELVPCDEVLSPLPPLAPFDISTRKFLQAMKPILDEASVEN